MTYIKRAALQKAARFLLPNAFCLLLIACCPLAFLALLRLQSGEV
jgi:hypothetical protein